MKHHYNRAAKKRLVNLMLNEDLLVQARGVTDNLSGVVESLLADFLARQRLQSAANAKVLQATIATWNNFSDEVGVFADEHSTL